MRICLISFHCCPFSRIGGDGVGGMNVYIKELASALAGQPGVTIDIFTRLQDPRRRRVNQISPALRVIHMEGGPQQPCDRRGLYAYLPEYIENMVEFLLREGCTYDLIYSHYWLSGLVGEWIKYRFELPLVHTYHTLGFLKKQVMLQAGEHEYRNHAEKHLVYVADRIISSSKEERDHLQSEFGVGRDKLRVVYPGVNQDLFCPLPREEWPLCTREDSCLLYVGRIEPVKGLGDIVEALRLLKQRAPGLYAKVCLKVIGGGEEAELSANPEVKRIHALLQEYGIQDRVRFLGSLSQEELKRFYAGAEALVVPSLYESFGLVVVEALACGTPVLVSKIGKMQSIVKDGYTGFSFRPQDPASLAACLQYFFAHKDSLWPPEKIQEDVISRFSWAKTAEKTVKIFREAMAEQGVSATTRSRRGGSLRPA